MLQDSEGHPVLKRRNLKIDSSDLLDQRIQPMFLSYGDPGFQDWVPDYGSPPLRYKNVDFVDYWTPV